MGQNGTAGGTRGAGALDDGRGRRVIEAFADGCALLGSSIESVGGIVRAAGAAFDDAARGIAGGAFLIGGTVGAAARVVEGVTGVVGLTLSAAGGLVGTAGSFVDAGTRTAGRGIARAGNSLRPRARANARIRLPADEPDAPPARPATRSGKG